jgi:hypothetical protein
MIERFIFLSLAVVFAGHSARADVGDLYTGAREAAMGGASTAIAEGDEAIFLQPAAMAGNTGATLYLLNADGELSTDSVTAVKTSTSYFNNISVSTLNNYLDQTFAAQGTLTPAITLPYFGFSVLLDQQYALLVQNQANPQVMLGMQTTNGFQFATGFSVFPDGRRRKKNRTLPPLTDDLRVGVGYKIMFRRGGYYTLTTDQVFNISETEIKNIVGSFGEGMSGDAGIQYIHTFNPHYQFLAGLDWAQIGNMSFNNGGQTQDQNLSLGVGAKMLLNRGASLTLGWDVKHLTDSMEWAKRNHLGLDLQLANIDLYGGLNDGYYLGGGAAVDLWLLKVTLLSYEQELDALSGQLGERLYMLRVTVKLPM